MLTKWFIKRKLKEVGKELAEEAWEKISWLIKNGEIDIQKDGVTFRVKKDV